MATRDEGPGTSTCLPEAHAHAHACPRGATKGSGPDSPLASEDLPQSGGRSDPFLKGHLMPRPDYAPCLSQDQAYWQRKALTGQLAEWGAWHAECEARGGQAHLPLPTTQKWPSPARCLPWPLLATAPQERPGLTARVTDRKRS